MIRRYPDPGRSGSVRNTDLVLTALAVALLSTSSTWGKATSFRGQLTTRDDCSLGNVRVWVPGHGDTLTQDLGEFTINLPAARYLPGDDVAFELKHDDCQVAWPPDHHAIIARDHYVKILLQHKDPRRRKTLSDGEFLLLSGIDETLDTLSGQVERLTEAIDRWMASLEDGSLEAERVERLRQLFERKRGQLVAFREVSTFWRSYLGRAKDLRDSFERNAPRAMRDSRYFEQLNTAIKAYNDAFAEMDGKGESYGAAVGRYWGPEQEDAYSDILAAAWEFHNVYFRDQLNRLKNRVNDLYAPDVEEKDREESRRSTTEFLQNWSESLAEQTAALERDVDRLLTGLRGGLGSLEAVSSNHGGDSEHLAS